MFRSEALNHSLYEVVSPMIPHQNQKKFRHRDYSSMKPDVNQAPRSVHKQLQRFQSILYQSTNYLSNEYLTNEYLSN